MPALPDARRERFAQMVARGTSVIDAYVSVGFKRNTGNATVYKQRPDITRRIEEIKEVLSQSSEIELRDFLKESGITPAHIVKKMFELASAAQKTGKYDQSAKILKDLGGELFGMFNERKSINQSNNSDQTNNGLLSYPIPTINITHLNQAVEALGVPGFSGTQIDGESEELVPAGTNVSEADKRRGDK